MRCSEYYPIFGIIIASIYLVGSLIIFSFATVSFFEYEEFPKSISLIGMITFSMIALMSALFIFAIVKKQHKLILYWLIFCFIILLVTGLSLFFVGVEEDSDILPALIVYASLIGFEIATINLSYSLYREIRKNNIENLANVIYKSDYENLNAGQ